MAIVANRGRRDLWLLAAGMMALAHPAFGQGAAPAAPPEAGQAPKSLLPDMFDDVPQATVSAPLVDTPAAALPDDPFAGTATTEETPTEELAEIKAEDPLANLVGPVTLPENAGTLDDRTGGLGNALFAGSDGRFVGLLLRRIDAPLASRWLQIMLTRALLTRATPPAGVNPGDWLAARGEALVAMGAAADAHRMIARVLPDRYTEGLYGVAANAAIASGDPLALCPLSQTARSFIENPFWELADAMCGSIEGDEFGASRLFDRLRRSGAVHGFDVGLGERLSSAVGGGRRGANPEWDAVNSLSAWRIGVASAAGLEIPDSLVEGATPMQAGWMVRLAGQPIARRAMLMPVAAGIGAISSSEANRILAASALELDPSAMAGSPGGQARLAQAAADMDARQEALRGLLGRGKDGSLERYGWQVAGAISAARITPGTDRLADAPAIVGALVTAGLLREAQGWWRLAADASGDVRAGVWALMAPADTAVPVTSSLYDSWASDVSAHRAALLAAGLRGLGRGTVGEAPAEIVNDWTRALDAAVAGRRRGEVLALAATGMQKGWANVPPDYLRRIAAAMKAVGLAAEAGLMVSEAAARG